MGLLMITIRPMQPQDFEPVAAWIPLAPLWQRYGLTAERARDRLAQALAQGDILLAADLPDHPACGFAWVVPDGAFNRSAYLCLIGVHPNRSGAGIGSALLDGAEAAARVHSRELFLLVSDFNTAAQRFYRRHGYEQIGAIPGYVLPDVAELLFWKQL
jgi:ribosomal protein S18 acetylase RimI-like enzyme